MDVRHRLVNALWLLGLILVVVSQVGAKDDPEELKGEETRIIDILRNATSFEGEMVVVEGIIETECPSGCWFILNDNTASIFVDILPSNFVIPQKRGEDAKVYGNVTIQNGDPMIIGKMVKISGEIYR